MAFGNMGLTNAEASQIFENGFGKAGIGEDEVYYDPIRNIDKRVQMGKALEQDALTKAASITSTTGGTVTAYGMLPPFIDPSIVDRTVRETPLVRLLPRRAVRGRSVVYNALTAKNGAGFQLEDASFADQVDTFTATNTAVKFLYAVGRVTGVASASQTIINLMAEDIRIKTASMNEGLENEIINGNTSTNAAGFQGLIQLLSTNSTSNSGANITLAQIRADLNTCFEANGLVDIAVTDGSTFNYIKGLLMDYQRNIDRPSGQLDFGIPDAFVFDGVLFIKDRYMPTTAGSRGMLFLDTRYVYLAVLQDYTFEELAKSNDSQKYMLKWYGVLINVFEAAMAQRTSLA